MQAYDSGCTMMHCRPENLARMNNRSAQTSLRNILEMQEVILAVEQDYSKHFNRLKNQVSKAFIHLTAILKAFSFVKRNIAPDVFDGDLTDTHFPSFEFWRLISPAWGR
jgi:hypothetical protein